MQRDFWVKNRVFGENGCAKRLFELIWGFRGKWPCKGIFGLKMGFGRK